MQNIVGKRRGSERDPGLSASAKILQSSSVFGRTTSKDGVSELLGFAAGQGINDEFDLLVRIDLTYRDDSSSPGATNSLRDLSLGRRSAS